MMADFTLSRQNADLLADHLDATLPDPQTIPPNLQTPLDILHAFVLQTLHRKYGQPAVEVSYGDQYGRQDGESKTAQDYACLLACPVVCEGSTTSPESEA